MRYETQVDILKSLAAICNHYSACSFSVEISRSFDATRYVYVYIYFLRSLIYIIIIINNNSCVMAW